MDNTTSHAERYQPSINIGQAPAITAPLLYLGTAYLFLLVAAWMLFQHRVEVAEGHYGVPGVILMVHIFTLGFLSMTAFGILNQWIPVVFDVPAWSLRRVVWHYGLFLLGIVGFAVGFKYQWWFLVASGGSVLALAILWWSQGVMSQLRRSTKPRDPVYWGIFTAVLGFNGVWLLGLFMAASFLGWWPEYQVLRVHIATALGAWMGILVLTVQQKLNPMFSMSRAEGVRFAWPMVVVGAGIVFAWVALFTDARLFSLGGVLWSVGAVMAILQGRAVLRQGRAKSFDRVFVGVGAAWILLLGAAVMSVMVSPLAIILAFWGFYTLILSYQGRILPFIVAVAVAKRLPGPVYKAFFMAQAMHPKNLPVMVGIGGLAGAFLMILGRLVHQAGWIGGSAGIAVALVVLHLGSLWLAIREGRKKGPPVRS